MVRNRKETTEKSKKKPGLSTQIFIALLAGALLGVVIHYWIPSSYIKDTVIVEGVLYVIGQGFIRLMQMLVVPLVFCSLVCGSMSIGDSKTLGKVGVKTIGFYLVTTALAVCIALGTALLIHPGLGLNMSAVQKADLSSTAADSSVSLVDTLLNIIPKNPVQALASGDMLAIIFFALFVGIILSTMGRKVEVVHRFFEQFNDIMMKMTSMVMYVAPIGVFCLILPVVAENGPQILGNLGLVLLCAYIGYFLHAVIVYSATVKALGGVSPLAFFKGMFPAMAMAFSSASSVGTLPLNLECTERLGARRDIASFVLPLGATINMDGTAIYQGVCAVFIATCYGVDLTLGQMITIVLTATLASIGTAGVPGSGVVMLTMVLESVNLPVAGIGLVIGVDRIFDMGRTTVNITGDAACALVVSNLEKKAEARRAARRPRA